MTDHSKLLTDLNDNEIYHLEVLSFEPDIYLANIVLGGERYRVYRAPGELLREFSQLAIKKHFKAFKITRTELIHQSSYDEMIGNPAPAGGEFKVKIANPQADHS